ncbi:Cyclin, N-terminal domain [Popillia japonica]|uniref:Cyclin, N-terminal domain n=1 Tax=Popillia japonica TaxID=7064 RepID=A0AAW1MZG3_POPJA
MSRRGKRRSRPVPDAINVKQIAYELEKALILEHKYKSNLLIANSDQKPGDVTLTARDAAVQSIRFLKFWLHLPSEVFFTAVGLLDRFLTKMKVQERFLACVSISCLYIAAETHKYMQRMCDIIRKKLDVESREQPITVYSYLNLFLRILDCLSLQLNLKSSAPKLLQKKVLRRRLEVIMTNNQCASERAPVIALALLQYEIHTFITVQDPKIEILKLLSRLNELQCVCMVTPEEFRSSYLSIGHILKEYDDHCKMSNVQKLKWRFSTSTLFTPRPLDKFHTNLNRISEDEFSSLFCSTAILSAIERSRRDMTIIGGFRIKRYTY